jgi:TonB family protein
MKRRWQMCFAFMLAHASAAVAQSAGGHEPSAPRDSVYIEAQVTTPAQLVTGGRVDYPDSLRKAKIGGAVLAQWVVDTSGIPEIETIRILRSPNEGLSESARAAVRQMRFSPARIANRKVRQLVQMPFQFRP